MAPQIRQVSVKKGGDAALDGGRLLLERVFPGWNKKDQLCIAESPGPFFFAGRVAEDVAPDDVLERSQIASHRLRDVAQDCHAGRADVVEGERKRTRRSHQRLGQLAGEETVVRRGVDDAVRRGGGDGRRRWRDVVTADDAVIIAVGSLQGVIGGLLDDDAGRDGRGGDEVDG